VTGMPKQIKSVDNFYHTVIRTALFMSALLLLILFACGGGFKGDSSEASILSDPIFGHPDTLNIVP
jgi:hypothetical protein